MKRLNLKNDEILKLKMRTVGDYINIPMYVRIAKSGVDPIQHMDKNYPLGKKYRVCEDICEYWRNKEPRKFMEFTQDGYASDANEYHAKFGYFQGGVIYPASKMPKEFSRFTLEAVSYGAFIMQSTTWAYTSVMFKLVEVKNVELPNSGK